MDEVTLTPEQEEALREQLERGVAFEEMLTTKGWAYIQSYYQNQIKLFVNALMNEAKPIIEFENKRQELLGLKRLLGQVDSAVKTLQAKREEDKKNESA